MPNLPILAPAGYAPLSAITFAGPDGGVVVDQDRPLPVGERAYGGVSPIVIDVEQEPRRGVAIIASMAGAVALKLADGSVFAAPVQVGLSILPFAVRTVVGAGTTATATYANLI